MARGKRLSGDIVRLSGAEAAKQVNFSDIVKLTNEDLKEFKKVITKMNSTANKRAKRLQDVTGEINPHFSVKNIKNINDAKRAFKQVKDFLNNESKSLSGLQRTRIASSKQLATAMEEHKIEFEDDTFLHDPTNYDTFWRSYEEIRKLKGYSKEYKYEVLSELKDVMKNFPTADVEDLTTIMDSEINNIYISAIDAIENARTTFEEMNESDEEYTIDDSDMPWS